MGDRKAEIKRKTKETDIRVSIDLDGSGKANINTGIGFFDHMLESFARHGFFDLEVSCKGDLNVDCHHTIEDVGIVLGQAIKDACGDKLGISRYGSAIIPMDDALVMCAVDLCGRPYLGFEGSFSSERVGYFDTEMVREFFYAISYSAMMNIHLRQLAGENTHHIIEAMFKAFAKSLDMSVTLDPRINEVLSTKGSI